LLRISTPIPTTGRSVGAEPIQPIARHLPESFNIGRELNGFSVNGIGGAGAHIVSGNVQAKSREAFAVENRVISSECNVSQIIPVPEYIGPPAKRRAPTFPGAP